MFQPLASEFAPSARANFISSGAEEGTRVIGRFLRAARTHLNLQVAYISEIVGDQSIFCHVDAPGLEAIVKPGDRRSLDDVYCRHILAGRMPELIPDTAAEPIAVSMPITAAIPIGAHVSVPVRLADGKLFGMFCCLGPYADLTLNTRDLNMMKAFAELAGYELDREQAAARQRSEMRAPIERLLVSRALDIVYQPIWRLGKARPIGFESLSRFAPAPVRSPDKWFAEAATVGLGLELELLAIQAALPALGQLPTDTYLTINASPATASSAAFRTLLACHPLERIVLEITEQEALGDIEMFKGALAPLRGAGLRLAVDDAGAGYAGLQQILQIRPDIIKLDRFFVSEIATDPGRRALAAALANFAAAVGCSIVAEGVETREELATLYGLGFEIIQGYLLGRPQSLDSALRLMTGACHPMTGPSSSFSR